MVFFSPSSFPAEFSWVGCLFDPGSWLPQGDFMHLMIIAHFVDWDKMDSYLTYTAVILISIYVYYKLLLKICWLVHRQCIKTYIKFYHLWIALFDDTMLLHFSDSLNVAWSLTYNPNVTIKLLTGWWKYLYLALTCCFSSLMCMTNRSQSIA